MAYPPRMSEATTNNDRKLAKILAVIFVVALVMGPGPGIRLIDPGPDHSGPTPTFLGLPAIYAWGLFWFLVEAAVVITAYRTIWRSEAEDDR